MNEENYKGLKKQLETHSLDIASQLTILELAYKNEQQLQAYKTKEYKIKEYCNSKEFEYNFESIADMKNCHRNILKILNEGDK